VSPMKKTYKKPSVAILMFEAKEELTSEITAAMSDMVDFGEEVEEW